MANQSLLLRRGEVGPESSSEGEAEAPPSIPEARPSTIGVRVDNPAWRKYMRKYDVWEGDERDQLAKHEVPAERVRPGDGGDSPVHRKD